MTTFGDNWEAFILGAERGDLREVRRLYEEYSDFPDLQAQLLKCNFYIGGNGALHRASEYGHLAIVQFLVEECEIDVYELDDRNCIAFHCAVEHDQIGIVRYLMEMGGNFPDSLDFAGVSCLQRVARQGNLQMVKFLVDICDANVNIACENGETLLHDQEFPITVESIRYLVETCTINLHAKDIRGRAPIDVAISSATNPDFDVMVEYFTAMGGIPSPPSSPPSSPPNDSP